MISLVKKAKRYRNTVPVVQKTGAWDFMVVQRRKLGHTCLLDAAHRSGAPPELQPPEKIMSFLLPLSRAALMAAILAPTLLLSDHAFAAELSPAYVGADLGLASNYGQ